MKRKDIIKELQNYVNFCEDNNKSVDSETILDKVREFGMLPKTEGITFSGTYTIYKFEEDITEEDRAWARERMERD